MQEEKQCSKCLLYKSLGYFSAKSGQCKTCKCAYTKEYLHSEAGLMKQLFNTLRRKSEDRGHSLPTFTKGALTSFLVGNGFNALYQAWQVQGYPTNLKPSIDRLDSTLPYTLDNIQLVTWEHNNHAAYNERKEGRRITRQNKTCVQLTPEGVFVKEYPSFANAARVNNFCRTHLGNAAKKGTLASGYRWAYGAPRVASIATPRDTSNKRKEDIDAEVHEPK